MIGHSREPGTVHPRVGGEQSFGCKSLNKNIGSSPRRRGTVMLEVNLCVRWRFIPA